MVYDLGGEQHTLSFHLRLGIFLLFASRLVIIARITTSAEWMAFFVIAEVGRRQAGLVLQRGAQADLELESP